MRFLLFLLFDYYVRCLGYITSPDWWKTKLLCKVGVAEIQRTASYICASYISVSLWNMLGVCFILKWIFDTL